MRDGVTSWTPPTQSTQEMNNLPTRLNTQQENKVRQKTTPPSQKSHQLHHSQHLLKVLKTKPLHGLE